VIVGVREPYDWARVLDWLGTRAIPGLEDVPDGVYRRGGLAVRFADGALHVSGEVEPVGALHVEGSAHADVVARVFDAGHDPAVLAEAWGDSAEASALLARSPGIRVPGAWSGWELAVRAVLGQQVSVAGARKTAEKLVALHGGAFPAPEALIDGPLPGMPASRQRSLRALAAAVAGGLRLDPPLDLAATRAELLDLPGIGPWTVEYVAMRALRDPDAWPASDLWLRRAVVDAGALRPFRAYAAMLIWQP
jgi:3-methyladenine DNA glycosylase/8-oxoguanine DNA glycosylase